MDVSGADGQQALFAETWSETLFDSDGFDPHAVIQQFAQLPESVRRAQISRIERRQIDRGLFTQLITQSPPPDSEVGWSSRILKREESLLPYLGKELVCVLIRLPGIDYTVEIDPVANTVVHWEWQAGRR